MKCFKRLLRRKHWAVHKFSSALRGSKEEKWALKIILILGACQQAVPTRMSKKFENKSTRIVGTQLTKSQKLQEFYLEVLRRLRENVRRKRPELWRSGDWFLHHDNTPARTALSVTRYLASLGWTVIPHPLYSLDLAPCHFFLFPTVKKNIERKEICHRGVGENSFAGGTQQHQASAVPEVLHTVGKKISQVYCLQWRVFWRGLSVFCLKYKWIFFFKENPVFFGSPLV